MSGIEGFWLKRGEKKHVTIRERYSFFIIFIQSKNTTKRAVLHLGNLLKI